MPAGKMHLNEFEITRSLVSRLISGQFPQWSKLPIAPVKSIGTDNAIYRLGDEMVVRLPRIYWAVDQVEKEHHWLPRLAPHLPIALPVPLARGTPAEGYPWPWSVYQWINGLDANTAQNINLNDTARQLAHFINTLQRIEPTHGPDAVEHNLRGIPLPARDQQTRAAMHQLTGMLDTAIIERIWTAAVQVPGWSHLPVWFHGDLLPGNLLIDQGRISAIIDFSGAGVGDPACDLMIAWALFSGESRAIFRAALQVDHATWMRGRGHALSQALIFIPYYIKTNPVGVRNAFRTIENIISEFETDSTG